MSTPSDPPLPKPLIFRPPSSSQSSFSSTTTPFTAPTHSFLTAQPWHVTHSTLPMWRKARNVTITYSSLPSSPTLLSDTVTYLPLSPSTTKLKTIRGIDHPNPLVPGGAAYTWRGNGWLRIAGASHWEILGYGDEEGGWVVTWFEKTVFTPRGVDVYCARMGGLSEGLVGRILGALRGVLGGGEMGGLVDGLVGVRWDW